MHKTAGVKLYSAFDLHQLTLKHCKITDILVKIRILENIKCYNSIALPSRQLVLNCHLVWNTETMCLSQRAPLTSILLGDFQLGPRNLYPFIYIIHRKYACVEDGKILKLTDMNQVYIFTPNNLYLFVLGSRF